MLSQAKKKTVSRKKAKAKAVVYLREVELRYRKRKVTDAAAIGKPIKAAKQVVDLFADLQNEAKEKLLTIHLDTKNRILCFEAIAMGSLNAIYMRPMEVFRTSFPVNAHGAIVVHNHPSGDPRPSANDKALTKTLARMADDMGLSFDDHIIIGAGRYYSFAEHGLL